MRLGKTALSHFGSQVVVTLSGFIATWFIANILGAGGLGLYSIIVSLGVFWLVIPASAVSLATTKRMSEGEDSAGYFGGGLLLSAGIAVSGAALILSAGELLGGIVSRNREIMRVLTTYNVEIAALYVATVAFRTTLAALDGQKRVAVTGRLQASERVGRSIVQVATLVAGLGVVGFTVSHAGSLFVVAMAAAILSKYRPTLPTVEQIRSLLNYAKFAWVGALRGRVFGWLDTIVLSFFVGASLIGIYEAAWGISSMLAMASSSISKTLFPEVSDISETEEYDTIRHYLDEALAFSGVFVIPGLFGAITMGERILRFYRPEFGSGSGILIILIIAYTADVYASQFLNIINAINRPDVAFRVNGAFIIVNMTLNITLIWQIGWYGAAIATAVSTAVRTTGGYIALRRIFDSINVPLGEIARQVLASVVMAVVIWPIIGRIPSGRLGTLWLVGIGATVYGVVLLTLSVRTRTKIQGLLPVMV